MTTEISSVELTKDARRAIRMLVYQHKKSLVENLLAEKQLAYSSQSKKHLEQRIQTYILNNDLVFEDIVDWLVRLEGWGNQHIYFYKGDIPDEVQRWKTKESSYSTLRERNPDWLENFDQIKPMFMPDSRQLVSVVWSRHPQDNIRFVWVESDVSREEAIDLESRIQAQVDVQDILDNSDNNDDYLAEDIEIKVYRIVSQRRLIVFEWNLVTCNAMLLIRSLSNTNYLSVKKQIEEQLHPVLPVKYFQRVNINSVVNSLRRSPLVSRRKVNLETDSLGQAILISHDSRNGVDDDRALASADDVMSGYSSGRGGDLYWHTKPSDLSEIVHTKIIIKNQDDQRIYLPAEYSEKDIRNVLRNIRNNC